MGQAVILITGGSEHSIKPYAACLERRDAQVRLASPHQGRLSLADPMNGATALLLTGGADVDPPLYGEAVDSGAGVETNRPRDDMELALLRHALERDLPVLGICRGMQLMNVAFGGKLIQDLPNHRETESSGKGSAFHQIYISPGAKLAAILGSGGFFRVNSRHHQGLKESQKSPALLASAYSLGDGLIEALESPAHDWVIGVQSHPENEEEMPKAFGRLFQSFVERAEAAAARKGVDSTS